MSYTAARTPILVLFATLAGAAVCSPAAAQGCPGVLRLPDDEDSLECTDEWVFNDKLDAEFGPDEVVYAGPDGNGFLFSGRGFAISGSGPIEVTFIIRDSFSGSGEIDEDEWSPETEDERFEGWGWELAVTDEMKTASKSVPVGTIYRMLLRDPEDYFIAIDYFLRGPSVIDEKTAAFAHYRDFNLTIILRRITRTCSMWANVSGDVNDTFFGDVAYYNFAVDGMFVDPGILRMMGVDPDSTPEGGDSFSAFIKKETRATGNFALSLRDFKLNQEFDTLSEKGDAVQALLGLGNSKDVEAVRQVVGMLNNQFALSMSALLDSLPKPGEGGETSAVTIELTGVTATVGAVAEGGRIPFELVPGTPSAATLLLAVDKPRNLVYGTFLGDLYTKGPYTLPSVPDPRQLHVHVEANFTALEGQNTCVMAAQPG